jgi:streptogramin lyase
MRPGTIVLITVVVAAGCGGSQTTQPPVSASPSVSPAPSMAAANCPQPSALPAGVLASIPLQPGDRPVGIATGFGSVWVESHEGHTLYRLDPASNTVIARIDLGQFSAGDPGIGFGRVWVAHNILDSTTTLVVDPTSNQVVGRVQAATLDFTFGSGSVWMASNYFDSLLRIDPATYQVVASIKITGDQGTAMFGAGFIWLAANSEPGGYSGVITKIDPSTNKVVGTLHTARMPGRYGQGITFAFGAIWVKAYNNDKLLRIDPASGKTTTYTIPQFSPPSQYFEVFIGSDASSLWMRTADCTISQVDPHTGQVVATYPADPNGGGGHQTIGFGSLWLTNFRSDTVWRDKIP